MRKLLALMAVLALLVTACSNDEAPPADEDPMGALLAAFEETGNAEAYTVRVSLVSTPESIVAGSDGDLTPEDAETILGSSLTFSGTKSEDPADMSGRVSLEVPGTEGAELVTVGPDLFVRVDVPGLTELAGADPASIEDFTRQAEAAGATFVQPLLDGEFVRFEGIQDLATEQLGGATPPGPAESEEFMEQLREALKESSTVTSEGSDDVGEHLVASINVRDLYSRLQQLLPQLGVPMIPGSVPDPSEIPEGDFQLDAWISDGKVVQLEVDLIKLGELLEDEAPEGVEEAAVRLELSDEVEEVTEPEAATTVTSEEISALVTGLLFGGAFGGGLPSDTQVTAPPGSAPTDKPGDSPKGGGGAPEDILEDLEIDCSIYKGLPPETFQGLPQETLDQLEQICPGLVPD